VDVKIGALLRLCENGQDATLELKPTSGEADNRSCGSIAVRLDAIDVSTAGAMAVGNAMQDTELAGVDHSAAALDSTALQVLDGGVALVPKTTDFLNSLGNVMSKLDLFVQIVDKTAKVSIIHGHMTC
jgi:hypothetical protein